MKHAKSILLTAVLLLGFVTLQAAAGKWDIKGQTIEAETGIPIPYATVVLFDRADSSMVAGSVSADDGSFVIEKVTAGEYYVKLSFIGYEDQYILSIDFNADSRTIDLGRITLYPAAASLAGVEVTARVSAVSNSIDKQVLNVDKNLSAAGGTAVDALRLSPSVQVDGEGNVKLRGSSAFTVLINGKPTTLEPDEVLRQTPANLISKIEVITNPSVKYSAEGGAGIINIILKKGAQSGLNGMVNGTAGTRGKYAGDVSINLNREKISLSAGLDWRDWNTTGLNNYYRDMINPDTVHHAIMLQDRLINESNLGFRFGLDYNPNERNNISYSFHSGYNALEGDIKVKTSGYTVPAGREKYSYDTYYILQKPKFYTNNLAYTRQLGKAGSSLSLNGYYSYIDYYLLTSQSLSETDPEYNITDTEPYLQDILNDNFSHDFRFDADYTLPITEKTTLETGGSLHSYTRFLDVTYASFDHNLGNWVNHPVYTNQYDFNELVYAGYANINTSLLGISITAGLRAEYMDRLLKRHAEKEGYTYDVLHLFPAFSLARPIDERQSLKLAMTHRVNRPDEYMMNPFPEFEDDYFYSEGNPYLLPEYVRNIELGYQYAADKTTLSSNLFFRETNDKIEQRLWIEEDEKIHTSFHNDCEDRSIGLELMGNFELAEWWSLNASSSVYHYTIEGKLFEDPFRQSRVSWNAQLVNSFHIGESTSVQLIGYYSSRTARSQGYLTGYYFVDAALKQQLLKGRLSLSLQCKDIFQSLNYDLVTETGNMNLLGDFNNESPILLFSLNFQINNFKKQTRDVETEFDM